MAHPEAASESPRRDGRRDAVAQPTHDHGHGQAHGHSHAHAHGGAASGRRLAITLGLVIAYMVAEAVGGFLTHSLALLADAGHMLSDAAALGLSLFALRISQRRPADPL